MPVEDSNYRGINVTPVIARLFEKVVYHTQAKSVIENNLSHTQFAYRQAGNCTNALLAIHYCLNACMSGADCSAVRIFTMDFSKAFDFVNHTIFVCQTETATPTSVHYQLVSQFPLCKTTRKVA